MIYILNTNLKAGKNVKAALCDIYGLGKKSASEICDRLGISSYLKIEQLPSFQISRLTRLVEQQYQIGARVSRREQKEKERLIRISSYRGIRHTQGLPCRGQRTHGNARTTRRLGGSAKKKRRAGR